MNASGSAGERCRSQQHTLCERHPLSSCSPWPVSSSGRSRCGVLGGRPCAVGVHGGGTPPPGRPPSRSLWATVCPADSAPAAAHPQARDIPEIIGRVHFPSSAAPARPQKRESPRPPTGLFGLEGGSALRPAALCPRNPGLPTTSVRPFPRKSWPRGGVGPPPLPRTGPLETVQEEVARKPPPGGKASRRRLRPVSDGVPPQMPGVHPPRVRGEGATRSWWTRKPGSRQLGSECPLAQCLWSCWGRGKSLCGASCSRREQQAVFTT